MPPEVSSVLPQVTKLTPLLSPVSPKSKLKPIHIDCQGTRRMNLTKKKLIPVLVFVLTTFSILRQLNITIISSLSSSPTITLELAHRETCFNSSSTCRKTRIQSNKEGSSRNHNQPPAKARTLTRKEWLFLLKIISHRVPCNLLVFGFENQYGHFSSLNAEGYTVFLEDDPNKLRKIKTNSNNTRAYKVEYQTVAGEAYKLLKHAREKLVCTPASSGMLKLSRCKLALKKLPQEVYRLKWDVVVVDGPSSNGAEAPGRMNVIYTAGTLARTGNATDVLVHDADRMIEKWYSWEFLCDENLVSSKGKFRHFRIAGVSNTTKFCST